MFKDFLNHTCNIYHLEEVPVNAGYGIKAGSVKKPQNEPAAENVPCHFHTKTNNTLEIVQREPYSSVEGEIKLSLPAGTDIRINDIIEDCRDGMKYRAGKPSEVYGGHHIVVMLKRMEGMVSAI